MDWIAIRALFGAALLGSFVGLVVGAGCIDRPEIHTAYARGYAAAVDSVRAFADWQARRDAALPRMLEAYGIRFDVLVALKGQRDSTVAVIHAGGAR